MVENKILFVLLLSLLYCYVAANEDRNVQMRFQDVTTKVRSNGDVKDFKSFKQQFNKTYTASSEKKAKENFVKTVANIEAHNKRSNETYKRGINAMSDMSFEEKKKRLGLKRPVNTRMAAMLAQHVLKNVSVPDSVDYTKFFPPIKNQKDCGACWSFAAVSVVEYWSRRSTRSKSYSEQNLIDCVTAASGCNGGWPTDAFNYMRDEGISDGLKYVFKAKDQKCQRTGKQYPAILKIPNSCEVDLQGNEEDLKKIIAQYGPVAGTMAVTEGFAEYKSGVFYDTTCSKHFLDHAITIVGYGTDESYGENKDYWIIRNSFGTSWGMDGYGYLARNRNNSCLIALYAFFPC